MDDPILALIDSKLAAAAKAPADALTDEQAAAALATLVEEARQQHWSGTPGDAVERLRLLAENVPSVLDLLLDALSVSPTEHLARAKDRTVAATIADWDAAPSPGDGPQSASAVAPPPTMPAAGGAHQRPAHGRGEARFIDPDAAPRGSDGALLFPPAPPPDPRIDALRALASTDRRLRKGWWPSGWRTIMLSRGTEPDGSPAPAAWAAIVSTMGADEQAADFLARCWDGQDAAELARRDAATTRRLADIRRARAAGRFPG